MARRTQTKNKAKSRSKSNNQGTVTEEKWLTMRPFGSFVVPDPDEGEGHKFTKGEIASILPSTIPPGTDIEDSDYWIGKIRDIRAEIHADGTNNVKVKVQWFYSGNDVANVVKSFDASAIGEYERIISDHYDILDPECFNAFTPVAHFDENDPEPPFIAWDTFYQRYDFEYKTRTIKPKPGSSSCICNLPYDPNDPSPSSIMHFCPRPSCRRAYHHRCLLAAKSKESSTTTLVDTAEIEEGPSSTSAPSTPNENEGGDNDVIFSNPPTLSGAAFSRKQRQGKATQSNRNAAAAKSKANDDVIVISSIPTNTKRIRPTPNSKKEMGSLTLSPDNPTYSRSFRLLACSPDTDENIDLASLIPLTVSDVHPSSSAHNADDDEDNNPSHPKKKRKLSRKSTSKNEIEIETELIPSYTLADALGSLPYDLLHVAEQPLIRGAAFANGGVSGNIAFVTRARRLVYQLIEGASLPPADPESEGGMEEWEKIVFGEEAEGGMINAIVKIGKSKKQLLPFVCPECKSAI